MSKWFWAVAGWLFCAMALAQSSAPQSPASSQTAAQTQRALSVLYISASNVPLGKFHALAEIAAPMGITVHQRSLQSLPDGVEAGALPSADLLVIDAYQEEQVQSKLGRAFSAGLQRPYLWHLEKAPQGGGLPNALVQQLTAYYLNGGKSNFHNYFKTLRRWHDGQGLDGIAAPVVYPKSGIYHPHASERIFASAEEFLAWKQLKREQLPPVVAINFHQQQLAGLQTEVIEDLVERIEKAGALAMPYFNPAADDEAHRRLLTISGKRVADVLINTRIMLNAQGSRQAYESLGIPVIQATTYRRGSAQDWENDPQGIPAMDLPLYVAQPEFTGISDIQIASAVDGRSGSALPIDAQAQSVVNKALNLVQLQRKRNADKHVSLFFWNSPPGEKNFGSAFMNLPDSLRNALSAMQAAGYTVEVPEQQRLISQMQSLLTHIYRESSLAELLDQGLAETLPVDDYLHWLAQQPASVRKEVDARWGDAARSDMVIEHQGRKVFVIPRLKLGNIAVLPQPPRSDKRDDQEKALYHSLSSVPTHFYLATYLWARSVQGGGGSDALIHFGTHGSQEWLPGKERGLRVTDYPSLMVGDLPVIYPYIVDNIGEAQQAKRRGRALTLSYQTPPYQPAGMHKDWSALHDLLHAWQEQDTGAVKDQYRKDIVGKVVELRMDKDMGLRKPPNAGEAGEADFPQFVDKLHAHLHELAQTIQPLGLHTLGQAPKDEHRIATVAMMLGKPYWLASARVSGVKEQDVDEAMVGAYENMQNAVPLSMLRAYLKTGEIAAAADAPKDAVQALRKQLEQGRDWYARLGAQGELPALLSALSGEYIPTSYGGDPVKNPDAFPTGRNLYGFDPARVPSPQAWQAGKVAAEQMIDAHRSATGKTLGKVTFSLWSVETMRHQGILEAQALHLMGVEPIWDKGGRVVDVKLVDRQTLARPRVDVVLSATGLYRDHFPNTLKLLAKAAQLTATANEPDNPAFAFTQKLRAELIAKGAGAGAADDASQTRIFSTATGEYGTGLPDATLATDSWGDKEEGDAKLAKLYLHRMQSAYGPDEKRWGQQGVQGMANVNLYAEQLKGTQAAVLSRSSNTYGMLTTDDPFQYLGGIGLAVRAVSGEAPALYISNLRNPGATRTEAAQDFLAKELATRQFHPGYIEGLMKEGYSGTLRVLDATNNLWGWTAVAHEIVRDDQWQEMADVYVNDKHQLGVRDWMEKNNPHAYAQTMERMLEAARKGYWKADAKALDALKARYQQLQQQFDVHTSNQVFMDYVKQGSEVSALPALTALPAALTQLPATRDMFPPDPPRQTPESEPAPEQTPLPPPAPISGMVLEKVEPEPAANAPFQWQQALLWLLLVGVLAIGAVQQTRPMRRPEFSAP